MKIQLQLIAVALLLFSACSDGNDEMTAKIQVALIDAPADYEAVSIDVRDIQINVDGSEEGENGWQSLDGASPGVYDLLKLTNGEEAFMGEIELPEGKLGQVRLILGESNTLTLEGESIDLTVPSGSQSGLKINVDADIVAGITYKLVIDFDAAKSIVKAGNSGKYNLKPVVRASMDAQTGAIAGVVAPLNIAAVLYAISGSDSISTYADENGEYLARALTPGTYSVVAVPTENDTLASVSVSGLEVMAGEVTQADSLIFN